MKRAEVIGDPIAQSKSPLIHGFWLSALGLEGEYRATHMRTDDLPTFFAERRAQPDWAGCNVTMPHKEAVIPFLDRLDPLAEKLRAVNTIVRTGGGELLGFNTDVAGVAEPLKRHLIGGYPGHVATYAQIIGAGGAARAAVLGAIEAGYRDFDIFNRSPARADALAELAGAPFGTGNSLEALGPIRNPNEGEAVQRYSHILINATGMGMGGANPVPIDLSAYYPDTIVFDMVYAPLETPLLAQARALGLRTIDGLEMLVGQAAVAFEHFFGVKPPRERDAELRALLTGGQA
ncbi:shikimate dehydrogenase [Sandaracinobacter neustonicus]|uniref:Shikimate dehydrogenase (NADP(+)) n=1 Tax=Sandaracinobacter neustonicus TaxID=1715348 RepID=A0A501XT78_9SPHN|nr:shikimate dehydrogenase [Sandaracinobacter neustonicus]TPE63297.1 shikimate dehydrogenase [Sandaracinobacter neustonicus]